MLGLDVIHFGKTALTTKRLVAEMAIGGGVHLQNKAGKVHEDTMPMKTKETTTTLALVSPKAVERVAEVRDMKTVTNENLLTIEGDDGRTSSQHRSK